jgi:hypothetical protein
MIDQHKQSIEKKVERENGPHYLQGTTSSATKAIERPPTPEGEIEDEPAQRLPSGKRMMFIGKGNTGTTPFRLHPPTPPTAAKVLKRRGVESAGNAEKGSL